MSPKSFHEPAQIFIAIVVVYSLRYEGKERLWAQPPYCVISQSPNNRTVIPNRPYIDTYLFVINIGYLLQRLLDLWFSVVVEHFLILRPDSSRLKSLEVDLARLVSRVKSEL